MPLTLSFDGPVGSRLGTSRSRDVENCLAIVGPLELASKAARRIEDTASSRHFRIEVFSDRTNRDEKMGEVTLGTDIDRLTTLVSRGQVGRILLATPIGEHQRIAAVVRRLEGMAADVDLVLEGFSTYSALHFGTVEDVCIAPVLRRPLTPAQALIKSTADKVAAFLIVVLIAPL